MARTIRRKNAPHVVKTSPRLENWCRLYYPDGFEKFEDVRVKKKKMTDAAKGYGPAPKHYRKHYVRKERHASRQDLHIAVAYRDGDVLKPVQHRHSATWNYY